MKITVIGGNSGTGAQVVRLAADAGHEVTCLSRSGASNLPGGVRAIAGDALDQQVAARAIGGADAVVITVGGANGSDRHRTKVTQSVVTAMTAASVRRLVVHSSLGVGDSMQLMAPPARLFARTLLAKALADHSEQEALVAGSDLDWTIVRPGGLTNGPLGGSFVAQETSGGRQIRGPISRADVASFIVQVLPDPASFGRVYAMGGV